MAAYSAVVSLLQILEQQLLHSDQYPKPQIESLHGKVCSLQSSLEIIFPVPKIWRIELNDLEIQIRDAIYEAQDTIELFISRQTRLSSESEEIPGGDQNSTSLFLQDVQRIIAKLDPIREAAEKIERSIIGSIEDPQTGDLKSENPLPSTNSITKSTKTVGQENYLELLAGELLKNISQLRVIAITGMGGIGKTFLARNIYDDPRIQKHFNVRAWVTVSQKYHVRESLSALLVSMEIKGQNLGKRMNQWSDEQLAAYLYQSLYNTRYLVVMDDIWDTHFWDEVRNYFPDNKNGSRIVLTCRNVELAKYTKASGFHLQIDCLDEDHSWMLLSEKVFGVEPSSPRLEEIGRNIAAKCNGLPLALVVVAGLLKGRKAVEYWKSIEGNIDGALGQGEESVQEILSLSFNRMPVELKGCFLYMGAFPEDSKVLVSKLIKLWVAEGFLKPSPPESLEQVAKRYLKDLIDRNLVLIHEFSSDGQVKTCVMHDSVRDLAVKECEKHKFFHTVDGYVRELSEGTESVRRVSVHKNILMCIEDVYQCTKSIDAHTLLYAGPNHHHPLPFCLTFELLRVLDALTVYFIELPNELFELIHLRYLAFTYDEDLPSSVSKFRNLLILIVRQHPKIVLRRVPVLPVELWDMPQIRHLLFTESVLPDPSGAQDSVLLENLQSLSNVNAACCTKEILHNMPNLKKLGVWIEGPGAVKFFLFELKLLEAFKFTVLKPIPGEMIDFLPELAFPKTLRKLSLSGCGLPWVKMGVIGELPCLEVLKLREFAFQGQEWCSIEGHFLRLKFLLLESLGLIWWLADSSHFPVLERLIIRHCYELQEISGGIGEVPTLELMELVDCSPAAVESARKIRVEQENFGNYDLQLRIRSSWE